MTLTTKVALLKGTEDLELAPHCVHSLLQGLELAAQARLRVSATCEVEHAGPEIPQLDE